MFQNLFRPARSSALNAPEKKAMPPLIALSLAGRASWGPRDYASLAREGVMHNAVAYRCVRMIAEAASSVPWLLYEGAREIETHPLLALLASPNPLEDGKALFERWYAFLQCAGNSYLEALTAGGRGARAATCCAPTACASCPAPTAGRSPTTTRSTARPRPSRPSAARASCPCCTRRCSIRSTIIYGLSPIEAAARAIDVHNAGGDWTKALLDNAARPSGALVYKGPDGAPGLTDEQFQRLKHELEDAYQGSGNAGRPMVLEGGLDWKSMSYAPADMDFANSRDGAAREIALAFGVPPMLLGIPGDNTFSNYREANLSFWRQTVLPLVGAHRGAAHALARAPLRRRLAARLRRRRGGRARAATAKAPGTSSTPRRS